MTAVCRYFEWNSVRLLSCFRFALNVFRHASRGKLPYSISNHERYITCKFKGVFFDAVDISFGNTTYGVDGLELGVYCIYTYRYGGIWSSYITISHFIPVKSQ